MPYSDAPNETDNATQTDALKLRETWLDQVASAMMPIIAERAEDCVNTGEAFRFPTVKVACGWPVKGGLAKRRVRGECWDTSASEGNYSEIFISPVEHEPAEVAHILAHELIHALLGSAVGHKQPFPKIAKAIGLEGKPTATTGGEAFFEWAQPIIDAAGEYPHAKVTGNTGLKKKKTYLLKYQVPGTDAIIRITQKHLDEYGVPTLEIDGEHVEYEPAD